MNVHTYRTGNVNTTLPRRVGLLVGRHGGFDAHITSAGPTIRWIRLSKGNSKSKSHQNYKKSALVILITGKHRVTITKSQTNIILKKPGDYIFLRPKTLHSWGCLKHGTVLMAITWQP